MTLLDLSVLVTLTTDTGKILAKWHQVTPVANVFIFVLNTGKGRIISKRLLLQRTQVVRKPCFKELLAMSMDNGSNTAEQQIAYAMEVIN